LRKVIASAAKRYHSESGGEVTAEAQAYLLTATSDRADEILDVSREPLEQILVKMFSQASTVARSKTVTFGGDRDESVAAFATSETNVVTAAGLASFDWPWPFSGK
jgi:hypothetical protein